MTNDELLEELQMILRFIGDAIDNEVPMNMCDLNELWEWIDGVMGRVAE